MRRLLLALATVLLVVPATAATAGRTPPAPAHLTYIDGYYRGVAATTDVVVHALNVSGGYTTDVTIGYADAAGTTVGTPVAFVGLKFGPSMSGGRFWQDTRALVTPFGPTARQITVQATLYASTKGGRTAIDTVHAMVPLPVPTPPATDSPFTIWGPVS